MKGIINIFWILVSPSSFIVWFTLAKDFASMTIAFVMSVLGCFYLYYKVIDMRATAKLKEKELDGISTKK